MDKKGQLKLFSDHCPGQRRIQEGGLGVKTPLLMEIFFNWLEFFEKKILKYPLNFRPHKKIKNTTLEKFLGTPLPLGFINAIKSHSYSMNNIFA